MMTPIDTVSPRIIAPAADTQLSHVSAVSWGAIFAGAAAAAALSLILLILGVGLGLSSVSPWVHDGISAKTFGVSTIAWITLTSLFASGLGGYLAGRLRTRWLAVDIDEVHFRDTAHGLLSWSVASLATAALLTSTIGAIVNSGVQAGATLAGGAAVSATVAGTGAMMGASDNGDMRGDRSLGYYVDQLLRAPKSTAAVVDGAATSETSAIASTETTVPAGASRKRNRTGQMPRAEFGRIFTHALSTQALPEEDVQYLGSVIASRSDISQQQAEQRVRDTFASAQTKMRAAEATAKEAADKARKASAAAALWLFISLLIGAFTASLMATYGGRQRDA